MPRPASLALRAMPLVAAAALFASCATPPSPNVDALMAQMMSSSFRDQGIATVDRLQQTESDAACTRSQGEPLSEGEAKAIEAASLATVRWPADGRFIGDWKEGEKLAQSGRGLTWNEPSAATSANGGNCYNCHQLAPSEISYGTLGPSLYRYGKNRGVSDPSSAASKAVVTYTWGKLYNAKAYNACSGMPRFGHAGLLDETQLKNLMALLLDPLSPVNK